MDCRTARQLLEFARPRSLELEGSEAEALESHLADCPECGPIAQAERQIDDRMSRAMRAVALPDGLRDRLLNGLRQERRSARRRWFGRVAVAAAVVLAIGAGFYWHLSQPTRFELGQLAAFEPLREPEQLDEWFRGQGLRDVVVPRQFNYGRLVHHAVAEFHGRDVAQLWFVQDNNLARVYVLSAKQFDLDYLGRQGQGVAQGSHVTVELIRHPENRQIAYLVVYTGASLEPFLNRNLGAI